MKRRAVTALAPFLFVAACASTPKSKLEPWEIEERIESQIRFGMFKHEVRRILGEPTSRRWLVYGCAEREPILGQGLYYECWYWGSDATICFGIFPQDPPYVVAYVHASSSSTPR